MTLTGDSAVSVRTRLGQMKRHYLPIVEAKAQRIVEGGNDDQLDGLRLSSDVLELIGFVEQLLPNPQPLEAQAANQSTGIATDMSRHQEYSHTRLEKLEGGVVAGSIAVSAAFILVSIVSEMWLLGPLGLLLGFGTLAHALRR